MPMGGGSTAARAPDSRRTVCHHEGATGTASCTSYLASPHLASMQARGQPSPLSTSPPSHEGTLISIPTHSLWNWPAMHDRYIACVCRSFKETAVGHFQKILLLLNKHVQQLELPGLSVQILR